MIGGEAARRYAKALAGIAEREGALDAVGEELGSLAAALRANVNLRHFLMNPRFPRPKRIEVLDGVLQAAGASELVRNFARLVAEKDRIAELPAMADSYQRLADERHGRVRAQVVTAHDVNQRTLDLLREKLGAMTGFEVLMEVKKDENLIGGLTCRVGGVVMDGSIRNQLRNLRDSMIRS